MNSVDFDQYSRDTLSLIRTLVVKNETIAERDNAALMASGSSVSDDRRTWRYYMNMNGDYHPTDDVMTIQTLEDETEIVFNKANLVEYIRTAREYRKGGYWYTRLCDKYPHQIPLINGILFPIPYTTSIPAEDYKILSYNQSLVLWNEDQLIPEVQRQINALAPQLFGNDYIITDDLFLPLMVEEMQAFLYGIVHVTRLDNAYTRHAHDFFIWSHIDSFGNFSQYKASMNKEQIMWLFQNIAWVKNNAGQQYTFKKLMDNILTKGKIALAKYDMVESTENQLEDLTPTPLYRRLNMNLIEDYGRAASFIDTDAIILKQQPMAKDNFDETAAYREDALVKGTYSLHSDLPTKVLESSMADYTNRHADTLMSVAFNEWIYLAGNGYFQGRILVTDPVTGKQARINVADAYHIWKYLITTAQGGEPPVYICPVYYQNVSRINPPSTEEVRRVGGKYYIDPKLAFDIRNLWQPVGRFVAPDFLIQYAIEVYDMMWKHKKLYSQFYDLNKRARVKNATKTMYQTGVVKLSDYTNYQDLLDVYYFDFTAYSAEERRGFAWEIFKKATGWDTNIQPSMRVKQSDLIDIMTSLSSYTIHVVKEMADDVGVTEVINEVFMGDSRLTGPGHGLVADMSNVNLDVRSNLDLLHSLDSKTRLKPEKGPRASFTTSTAIKVPTVDKIKPANIHGDLRRYAVKVVSHDYIRIVEDFNPVLDELPPTYYGELDPIGLEPSVIPPTYYGTLGDE